MSVDFSYCCFLILEEETDNVLYVTTCNPVSLYFMNVSSKNGYFVDLYDIFPRTVGHVWQPFVTVAPLGNPLKGQVILHEEEVRKIKKKQRPTCNQKTAAKCLVMNRRQNH